MVYSETTRFASFFRFHLTEIEGHFAATRHVPWALNTPKMSLRPRLCKCRSSRWGANSAAVNPLAGFEGATLRRRKRNKKEKEGREQEKKLKDGREGGKPEINFWLRL